MQIGQAVGEPRTKMEQGGSRLSGHACIAVGRTGGDVLMEGKHAAHALDPIESRDEVHFGGPGIGKTDGHVTTDEGANEAFRTVHRAMLMAVHAVLSVGSGGLELLVGLNGERPRHGPGEQ